MRQIRIGLVCALLMLLVVAACNMNSTPSSPSQGAPVAGAVSKPDLQPPSTADADSDDDDDGDHDGNPGRPVDPNNFVTLIDNPLMPLTPGTVFEYRGETDGEPEIDRVHVTRETKVILGVTCTVVRDSEFVSDALTEATEDWYAQDKRGTVWYFGEASTQFENGQPVGTEGSWEAGVDGARPGIVMQAHPRVGDPYHQEFARGVAEDQAKVLSLRASVSVPFGSFTHCLKTKEWTRLEPGVAENKYYASGVGLLKSIMVRGGSEDSELVSVRTE